MVDYRNSLNPQKALIWRIVHRDNLPWILENGLYCSSDHHQAAPDWVGIGNPELIDKRSRRPIPCLPGGYLHDYVPFYFTPFSPMLYNIHTGRGGVQQRTNEEVVILVSSLPRLQDLNVPFLFTDSHAYYQWTNFYCDLSDLDKINWRILQTRDFHHDPDDPEKFEQYQAEALVYRHLPIDALLGIVCYTDFIKQTIERQLQAQHRHIRVITRPNWYF